jgi:hypothetical protein
MSKSRSAHNDKISTDDSHLRTASSTGRKYRLIIRAENPRSFTLTKHFQRTSWPAPAASLRFASAGNTGTDAVTAYDELISETVTRGGRPRTRNPRAR